MGNERVLPDIEERRNIIRAMPWVKELPTSPKKKCQETSMQHGTIHPCRMPARWEFTSLKENTRRLCFQHLLWRGLHSTELETKRVLKFLKRKFPAYAEGILR